MGYTRGVGRSAGERARAGAARAVAGASARARAWVERRPRLGTALDVDGLAMLALSTGVIACTGGASLLMAALYVDAVARRAPARAPEGVVLVVLGARLGAEGLPRDFELRLRRALAHGPGRDVLVVGGATTAGRPPEGEAGKAFLVAGGADPARVAVEARSRHTLENLRALRERLPTGRAALITNRYHLARALVLARGLGLALEPCAAEAPGAPRRLGATVVEAVYLHWYVTGRAFARAAGVRRMLDKIG
ncbi:MAG TPA: YdcF family protein [Polyangiaceae bacterium]|nr:YdcF family protein [Polyangiaceae bacterium]